MNFNIFSTTGSDRSESRHILHILLNIAAAQANIWGQQDVYVKKGSTISLTCSVNVHSTPPSSASVLWWAFRWFWHWKWTDFKIFFDVLYCRRYHGGSVVDFDSPRGGISLETEKTESGTTSKLLVTKAAISDSGNYTCVPSNANPASVSVHVLNGNFHMVFSDCFSCVDTIIWWKSS